MKKIDFYKFEYAPGREILGKQYEGNKEVLSVQDSDTWTNAIYISNNGIHDGSKQLIRIPKDAVPKLIESLQELVK